MCSKNGLGVGNSLIYNKSNEILVFVPLAACFPACVLGLACMPLAGLLGGLSLVALVWPACVVTREAWLVWVPVASVAWVHKTRSI